MSELFHRLKLIVRGKCHEDGCDQPCQRWTRLCSRHWSEHMERTAREIAEQQFEYDVRVQMAALRRLEAIRQRKIAEHER